MERERVGMWRSMRHRWRWMRGARRAVGGRTWRRRRGRGVASVWLCDLLVLGSWCLCWWSSLVVVGLCSSFVVRRSSFSFLFSVGWMVCWSFYPLCFVVYALLICLPPTHPILARFVSSPVSRILTRILTPYSVPPYLAFCA